MLLDFAPFQKQFYKVFFEFKVIGIVLHFALFQKEVVKATDTFTVSSFNRRG